MSQPATQSADAGASAGPRRLGVLGWPVAHSRSPAMHNAALHALGLDRDGWRYQLLPVPPERLAETARALPAAGFAGANVTIPHKHAALEIADSATEPARAIGAANTLTFCPDGSIEAENTDAPGFLAALGVSPKDMTALVLGAGGSARAAVWALREAGAREVSVWNRTPERATELARDLDVRAVPHPEGADLLVNCTSVGLHPADDAGEISAPAGLQQSATGREALNSLELTFDQVGIYAHVVDFVYNSAPTPLLAAARAHGAHAVGGLEVLLGQGALSFEIWTGRPAPLEIMRAALAG
ncbi:MAG TPA: shikimate dehydrogenase [Solirubrobacteraceae bacterium]|nr:shikimate dehydrogenase [Solirubrobacteraceae bacterium]